MCMDREGQSQSWQNMTKQDEHINKDPPTKKSVSYWQQRRKPKCFKTIPWTKPWPGITFLKNTSQTNPSSQTSLMASVCNGNMGFTTSLHHPIALPSAGLAAPVLKILPDWNPPVRNGLIKHRIMLNFDHGIRSPYSQVNGWLYNNLQQPCGNIQKSFIGENLPSTWMILDIGTPSLGNLQI